MATPSATQKTTNPTLPAVTQPAEQPQKAQQAQAPAPKPAPAPAGYTVKDGFVGPTPTQLASAQRAAAQKAQLGDVFQAPATNFLDLKGGGGGPVAQPGTIQGPLPTIQTPPGTDDRMKLAREALFKDPQFIEGVRNDTLFKDAVSMGKLQKVSDLAAPEADPNKPRDPNDPTVGMTDAERKAYDALPPDQKKRYDELHQQACATTTPPPEKSVQALRDLLTKGELGQYMEVEKALENNPDPNAKANLQALLFSGKLEQKDDYGRTTLSYIHDVATGDGEKTGMGVDRQKLVAGLLQDLANPDSMDQGTGNKDCAGTAAAYAMAKGDPAEYARVITTLAEKGEVNLTSPWSQLLGKPDSILRFNGNVDPDRPLTQSIFARSFVQAAASTGAGGSGETNPLKEMLAQFAAERFGLNGQQFANGLNMGNGVNGGGWKPAYMPKPDDPQRAQAEADAQKLLQGASEDKPVFALVNGHWVSVTKVEGDPAQVTYQDEHGEKKTVPMKDFLAGLNTVCFQDGDVPASMNDARNGGHGGGGDPTLGNGGGNRS